MWIQTQEWQRPFRPLCVCPGLVWQCPTDYAAAARCPLFCPGATEWSRAALAQACERHKAGEGVGRWQKLERPLKEVVGDTGFRTEKPGFKPRLCLSCGSVGLGPNAWPWVTQSSVT